MKKLLKGFFWIIALILFPITSVVYFIWPSRIFKGKMSHNWNQFWRVSYVIIAIIAVVSKFLICLVLVLMAYTAEDTFASISRENISAPDYKTSEDFYRLTGVRFPELEMVDSLFYDEGCLRACVWHEYKFIAKEGLDAEFFKRLNQACQTDSTHWSYTTGSLSDNHYLGTGEPIKEGESIYSYFIYPDQTPVDRSRGMCDRMVTLDDGTVVHEWDGSFISVEIQKDTIVLRDGWLR